LKKNIKLYVDKIIPYGNRGAYYGLVDDIAKIKKNIPLIIKESDLPIIIKELLSNENGIYFLDRVYQFIYCLELRKNYGSGKLTLFDCTNDTDTALDMYNDLSKDGWIKQPKDEFMKLFQEIQEFYSTIEFAELTTKDV
jgi:hypothetical protein